MRIAGVDKENRNVDLSSDDLTFVQKIRLTPIVIKLMEVDVNRNKHLLRLAELLSSLEKPEQHALSAVVAKLDAYMGVVSPEGDTEKVEQYAKQQQKEPEYIEETEYNEDERETSTSLSPDEGISATISLFLLALIVIAIPAGIVVFLIFQIKKGKRISRANVTLKQNIEMQLNSNDLTSPKGSLTSSQMVGLEKLRHLYNTQLKESIKGMEELRNKAKISYSIAIILGVASYFLYQSFLFIVFGVSLAGTIFFFIRAGFINFKYRIEYKSQVVKNVVHLINPDYEYKPDGHISLEEFNSSKLLTIEPNLCKGDDYVCGFVEKTFFEFCEFVAQSKFNTKDKDGSKRENVTTLFSGMFFIIDFNKNINGETFVVPDNAERLLGKFGQEFQSSSRGELVKLENIEFEKHFAVFSTNQVEARYILTPAMMEALVNIRNYMGRSFYMSFIGEKVYCGIEYNKPLFEPSIRKPVSFIDVALMHTLFTLIEVIITEMNLNTRIWTKD